MKKVRFFICRQLVKLCNAILPEGANVTIPPIDGYTPSKVGMSLLYTDDMIKKLTADMKMTRGMNITKGLARISEKFIA